MRLYNGQDASATSDLTPLLESLQNSSAPEEARARTWREHLGPSFAPALLSLQSRRGATTAIVSHISMEDRTAPHPEQLRVIALREGVSVPSLVLAAWAVVQARIAATTDATFGLVQTGRGGANSEMLGQLAAPCLNLLPLHVRDAAKGGGPPQHVVAIARSIQQALLSRTPEMEQARLVDVARWVGCAGKPLLNVSVNLLFATQARNLDEGQGEGDRDEDDDSESEPSPSQWTPVSVSPAWLPTRTALVAHDIASSRFHTTSLSRSRRTPRCPNCTFKESVMTCSSQKSR